MIEDRRHRRIHVAAALLNGTAIGAVLLQHDKIASVAIVASIALLVMSLDRIRVRLHLSRENA